MTIEAEKQVELKAKEILLNLTAAELVEQAIKNGEGLLTDTGALMSDTGKFTGRSPKDKFLVKDAKTENTVWWGDINIPMESATFDALLDKMLAWLPTSHRH